MYSLQTETGMHVVGYYQLVKVGLLHNIIFMKVNIFKKTPSALRIQFVSPNSFWSLKNYLQHTLLTETLFSRKYKRVISNRCRSNYTKLNEQ